MEDCSESQHVLIKRDGLVKVPDIVGAISFMCPLLEMSAVIRVAYSTSETLSLPLDRPSDRPTCGAVIMSFVPNGSCTEHSRIGSYINVSQLPSPRPPAATKAAYNQSASAGVPTANCSPTFVEFSHSAEKRLSQVNPIRHPFVLGSSTYAGGPRTCA